MNPLIIINASLKDRGFNNLISTLMQQLYPNFIQIQSRTIKLSLVCSIAIIATATLSGCSNVNTTSVQTSDPVQDTANVAENINSLIGTKVSVRNDIEKFVGDRALILDEDRVFAGETVLVINGSNQPFEFPREEGIEIFVTGVVEQFDAAELEQKYGLALDQSLSAQYENKPTIVANSIMLSPDPEEVTRNPEPFYNKTIAIEGEIDDIEDIITPQLFELDEEQVIGGEDLLVIANQPLESVAEDRNAIIIGTVHQFSRQFQQDYQLDWSSQVQQQIESEFLGKPVFVAEKLIVLSTEN